MGTIKGAQAVHQSCRFITALPREALASGAATCAGTSLPVGGKSTHSVITGHRRLVEALMFTRLDEVKEGDFFYHRSHGRNFGLQSGPHFGDFAG